MTNELDKFSQFVIEEAARQTGKHFIIESGAGREMENPPPELETDVEDLFGWLMTEEQVEEFKDSDRSELFSHDEIPFVLAKWSTDEENKLVISFEVQEEYV